VTTPSEPVFSPDSSIGDLLISSRALDEYRAMFNLSTDDLRRTILDCPGGASSATAEINDLPQTTVVAASRECIDDHGHKGEPAVARAPF
jgi:hypothetical protein